MQFSDGLGKPDFMGFDDRFTGGSGIPNLETNKKLLVDIRTCYPDRCSFAEYTYVYSRIIIK